VLAAHLCLLPLSDPSLVYSSVFLLSRTSGLQLAERERGRKKRAENIERED